MSSTPVTVTPRRSAVFFAALAIAMVIATYAAILATAAACVYLPYLLIANLQTLQAQIIILFLGGAVIASTILFSIVPRRDKFEAPGPLLEPAAHPQLFAEIRNIAEALREPVPSEVYLIGSVNAFVSDRGGFMGFRSRRVMGIGLPLFSILSVSELRGVLAHEFAHYYSGDTRLGPWTYKTQTTVARAFQNIGKLGQSVSLPAVFRIMQSMVTRVLSWYFLAFMRGIKFISRKAEFRADELACLMAGSHPMQRGLRAIHGAGMAWGVYWNSEVSPVLGAGSIPPIGPGFATFLAAPSIAEQVNHGIEKEIAEGKTEPYDSHPPLRDRLQALAKLKGAEVALRQESALCLLEDSNAAELQFVKDLNPKLAETRLSAVRWDQISETVTIPMWRQTTAENAPALQGLTVGAIPDAMKDLPRMCAKMKDPPGMLLDRDQRASRAMHVLGVGFALALLDNGWNLFEQPGLIRFRRSAEELNPFSMTNELHAGKITAEAWKARTNELGIAEVPLFGKTIPSAQPLT